MEPKIKDKQGILIELVRYCNDSVSGYQEVADETENSGIKTTFNQLARQRKGFAEELNNELIKHGEEKVESGSLEGNLHHSWLKIKTSLSDLSEDNLIETCKTGEEHLEEAYKKRVTDNNLSEYLRDKIKAQHKQIKESYHLLTSLQGDLESKN